MIKPASLTPMGRKCPICGKPSMEATPPFCSKRCADIDLSRWLKGVYAIPASDGEDNETGSDRRLNDDPFNAERDS